MSYQCNRQRKRLAQHPYDRAVILNAGIKVSGD
ncbi:hypothetical protein ACUOCP_18715, partial [Escherichia sp. R-CC3]